MELNNIITVNLSNDFKIEHFFEIIDIGIKPYPCYNIDNNNYNGINAPSVLIKYYCNDEVYHEQQYPITNGLQKIIDRVGFNNKIKGDISNYDKINIDKLLC